MKKVFILILFLIFSISISSIIRAETMIRFHTFEGYFGTNITLRVGTASQEEFEMLIVDIEDLVVTYDRLSDNKENNSNIHNIYYLNNNTNKEIEIAEELYNILLLAGTYYKFTEGYFDITIGNIIDVWKEYTGKYQGKEIGSVDFRKILNQASILSENLPAEYNNRLKLSENNGKFYAYLYEGIKLDLGAIAKGYVTEKIGEYLQTKAITEYTIDSGSSSIKLGSVGINVNFNNPIAMFENYGHIENLSDISIGTSGNDIQYFIYNGIRYHHIISPKEFIPTNYYHSISIINMDACFSDAVATAIFSMPQEVLEKFVKENDLDVLVYTKSGQIHNYLDEKYSFIENGERTLPSNNTRSFPIGTLIIIILIVVAAIIVVIIMIFLIIDNKKNGKKAIFRDIFMGASILAVVLSVFFSFLMWPKNEKTIINIYHDQKLVAKIDFDSVQVVQIFEDEVMPIHDKENSTITLMGSFVSGGHTHQFVIKYDINDRSVAVIAVECPDYSCKNQGASTREPIICLPNLIYIQFEETHE